MPTRSMRWRLRAPARAISTTPMPARIMVLPRSFSAITSSSTSMSSRAKSRTMRPLRTAGPRAHSQVEKARMQIRVASAEGWIDSGPITIQRRAPSTWVPMCGTRTASSSTSISTASLPAQPRQRW